MLMRHWKWLMLIGPPRRLGLFQTRYKDWIKGRGVSINELYLNKVNENVQRRDVVYTLKTHSCLSSNWWLIWIKMISQFRYNYDSPTPSIFLLIILKTKWLFVWIISYFEQSLKMKSVAHIMSPLHAFLDGWSGF